MAKDSSFDVVSQIDLQKKQEHSKIETLAQTGKSNTDVRKAGKQRRPKKELCEKCRKGEKNEKNFSGGRHAE